VPIGLATGEARRADGLARARLGWPRQTSVFSAPSRAALAARTYAEACALNAADRGRMLSRQSYGILPKIREIDALMSPALQANVREGHPEVTFAELTGLGHGLLERKKSPEGESVRCAILRAYLDVPDVRAVRAALGRARTGRDDIIDALACLMTASRVLDGTARVYPHAPQYDAKGLRMEIVA
jgi:predicted RNase H-like nuclease